MSGIWIAVLLLGGKIAGAPPFSWSSALSGFSPLEITESEQRIPVDASDLRAVQRLKLDPTALDGHPATGATRSSLEVRSTLEPVAGGCRLTALTMVVHITRVLPSLQLPRGAGLRLSRREWRKVVRRLEEHEDGHRRHALSAAHGLYLRLKALPHYENCERMRRSLTQMVRMARVRLELKDDFYDQRTRHGTRGAD